MAVRLLPRRSSTAGVVPTTANLIDGEMAVNTADRKIYTRAGSSIIELANLSVGGDRIINGNFDVWQRGNSFTSGGYTADRWSWDVAGASSASVSKSVFAPGAQSVLQGDPTNSMLCTLGTSTSSTGNAYVINYRAEDANTFSGETSTFSFAVYSSVAGSLSLTYSQNFGTGGSTAVIGLIQKFALSVGWNYLSATFALPSISGKTLGPGNNLQLRLWLSAGSSFNSQTSSLGVQTGTRNLGNIKWEAGNNATAYQPRDPSFELLLCQRYAYVIAFPEGTAYAPVTRLGTNQIIGWIDTFCDMRVIPVVTFLSGQIAFSDAVALSSPTLVPASVRRVALLGGVASGTAGLGSYVTGVIGNPAVILFDAEL